MVPPPSNKPTAQSSSRVMSSSRFPPPSQPNTSSVSLISSTARGRPIPLSDTNAANRTTALRELSRSQPITRRPYNQASGPPPSTTSTTTGTYSQPVLVRTYSGSISSSTRARSATRGGGISSARSRLDAPRSSSSSRRRRLRRPILAVSIARPLVRKKSLPRDDMKLPPLEAFTFKSILSEIEQDISADLDRIADICARSRYSLSNQYEIHVAPHGSGNSFIRAGPALVSAGPLRHDHGGPTLQAISIDDASTSQEGRATMRRRSTAYGTLETIMSSSRSSEEDGDKTKSAAEIAAQVRGRIQRLNPDGSGASSAHSTEAQASGELCDKRTKKSSRTRPTLAAAILGHSRAHGRSDPPPPRSRWASGTVLVGDPAVPETSHNHLVSSTTAEGLSCGYKNTGPVAKEQTLVSVSNSVAAAAIAVPEEPKDPLGLLGGFRFSIPWKGTFAADIHSAGQKSGKTESYAEGALRQLLKVSTPSEC